MRSQLSTTNPGTTIAKHSDDESVLMDILERIEEKHGFIPREISDELARILEIKEERIQKLRGKIETAYHKDVKKYLDDWKDEEGNLIMILHAIQNKHGYVPREMAMELSQALGIKLARIYEVLTFYHYFKLVPPGKRHISICMGTACYLKGGNNLLTRIEKTLKVKAGETTADRNWHLDVVRCIGCCGMAPAVVVDGKTYGKIKAADLPAIFDETLKKDRE